MHYIYSKIHALNELAFEVTCDLCNNDLTCIVQKLLTSTVDERTLGFWVLDIKNEMEYYSDKFRATLGYSGVKDFPNLPSSWQKAIEPESLERAIEAYGKHIDSGAKHQYSLEVTYNKKNGGKVDLMCHGKIVSWEDGEPKIMIGVHLPVSK